jgi:hypothetical protein
MAERYPAQNALAAWRVYDGEAVIVSPTDSTLHTLNEVATIIWTEANGRTPLSRIAARVCDEFDVDRDRARHDVDTFIEALRQRGLVDVLDTPRAE